MLIVKSKHCEIANATDSMFILNGVHDHERVGAERCSNLRYVVQWATDLNLENACDAQR